MTDSTHCSLKGLRDSALPSYLWQRHQPAFPVMRQCPRPQQGCPGLPEVCTESPWEKDCDSFSSLSLEARDSQWTAIGLLNSWCLWTLGVCPFNLPPFYTWRHLRFREVRKAVKVIQGESREAGVCTPIHYPSTTPLLLLSQSFTKCANEIYKVIWGYRLSSY